MISASVYQSPRVLAFSCKNELLDFIKKDYGVEQSDVSHELSIGRDFIDLQNVMLGNDNESPDAVQSGFWTGGESNIDFGSLYSYEAAEPCEQASSFFVPAASDYEEKPSLVKEPGRPKRSGNKSASRRRRTSRKELTEVNGVSGNLPVTAVKLFEYIKATMNDQQVFSVKDIDKTLDKSKRRIYEVLNVFEGINLVKHVDINLYKLLSEDNPAKGLQDEIDELAKIESEYDQLIQMMQQEMSTLKKSLSEN